MSRDNIGIEKSIVLHNCLNKNERYDLVITPHKQKIGYIRSKRQTRKNTIITKQKHFIKRRFSKRQNAVSESETNTLQELQDFKDLIKKNKPIDDQIQFSDSEASTLSSIKIKRKLRKSFINKPISQQTNRIQREF